MATNRVQKHGSILAVVCDNPTTPASGDPVRVGGLTGVALTDEGAGGNVAGETTVDFGMSVWSLNVDDDATGGIAVGETIYYQDTGTGTPATNLNNNSTTPEGIFGIALETVGDGLTATIKVLHIPTL